MAGFQGRGDIAKSGKRSPPLVCNRPNA